MCVVICFNFFTCIYYDSIKFLIVIRLYVKCIGDLYYLFFIILWSIFYYYFCLKKEIELDNFFKWSKKKCIVGICFI